jgi:hypothetical protein
MVLLRSKLIMKSWFAVIIAHARICNQISSEKYMRIKYQVFCLRRLVSKLVYYLLRLELV